MSLRIFVALCAASVLGAVLARALQVDLVWLGQIAGVGIVLSATAVAASPLFRATGRKVGLQTFLAVMLIGATSEIVGLATGYPFGQYRYSELWQPFLRIPSIGVFPLMLPFTWFIITASCLVAAHRRFSGWHAVALGALFATITDALLEPVLTGPVGFWRWTEPTPFWGAPFLNPVGWALTSLAAGWVLHRAAPQPRGVEAFVILAAISLGTAVIGLTHGEPRGAAALLLLPILWWLHRLPQERRSP